MQRKEWSIKAEHELRCEVSETEPLYVRLLSGNAEIFGIEMAATKEYVFLDENFAIFSWYGCVIELIGNCDAAYISDSTPMVAYVNTHIQLEARRDVALANLSDGPRVLIVGPSDHGKSTTSRILTAYAARLDRTPIYVDLDVAQSGITMSGCISAVPVDKSTLSVEDGFSNLNPLVYFHGHQTPKDNIELYKLLVMTLGNKIKSRFDRDIDARASGIIVNTTGWIDGPGFDIIIHIIQILAIDIVLVMSHDRLHSSLLSTVGENVTVIKLAHSGGVVQRDPNVRRRLRKSRIRQYFYGKYKFPTLISKLGTTSFSGNTVNMSINTQSLTSIYSPSRLTTKLSQIKFYRAGGLQLSEGMRLIGETATNTDNTQLIRINVSMDLMNSIVAILHPQDDDDEDISSSSSSNKFITQSQYQNQSTVSSTTNTISISNVAGFLCIVQIDMENDTLTYLSPCPGTLPSRHLLVGAIKWVE